MLARPGAEARAFLLEHVRACVAEVVGLDPSQLMEPRQGFFKLGMDSLMTVELRGRLQRSLELELPATIALEYPTVESLTEFLVEALQAGGESDGQESGVMKTAVGDRSNEDSELNDLDEDGLAARLDHTLREILDQTEGGG